MKDELSIRNKPCRLVLLWCNFLTPTKNPPDSQRPRAEGALSATGGFCPDEKPMPGIIPTPLTLDATSN
jgi:hypothetical protein